MTLKTKFFIVSSLILTLSLFSVTSASRHSTTEEMQYALEKSVNALHRTDDYYSIAQGKNYEMLLEKMKICDEESRFLKAIRERRLVGGKEAYTCVSMAYMIVLSRSNCLESFHSAVKAYASNNNDEGVYHSEQFYESRIEADK